MSPTFQLYRRHMLPAVWVLFLMFFAAAPLQAATQMPQFKVNAVNRKGDIDSSTYQGQVLLVNFFATWCPPCRQEIPGFIQLQKEFGPKGFSVIGISVDQAGSGIVKRFVDKIGINYPVGMGTSKVSEEFGGIIGIPATFLVNRKGNIVKSYRGYADHAVVAADIKGLL